VTDSIDRHRRRFLTVAATIAVARFGGPSPMEANQRVPGELAAIGRANGWINSPRLAPSSLAGKVVLVNFWTYTCINWIRTLPYIRAWADKYKQRLILIGVHTPEFPFEHSVDNVRRAVRQTRIEHPVVIDNDYAIWRAFGNRYWPALYFIDARGRVREHHFGEGEYGQSERVIQRLLAEGGAVGNDAGVVSVEAAGVEAPADWANLRSPENYIGYGRTENFASPRGAELDRRRLYAAPARLALNQWALAGEWTMGRQAAVGKGANGRIVSRFHARDLHLVMDRHGRASRYVSA
jgi:thiol-disulfide isomerase/thioredoxin